MNLPPNDFRITFGDVQVAEGYENSPELSMYPFGNGGGPEQKERFRLAMWNVVQQMTLLKTQENRNEVEAPVHARPDSIQTRKILSAEEKIDELNELRIKFGYTSPFTHTQEDALEKMIKGYDTLIMMPKDPSRDIIRNTWLAQESEAPCLLIAPNYSQLVTELKPLQAKGLSVLVYHRKQFSNGKSRFDKDLHDRFATLDAVATTPDMLDDEVLLNILHREVSRSNLGRFLVEGAHLLLEDSKALRCLSFFRLQFPRQPFTFMCDALQSFDIEKLSSRLFLMPTRPRPIKSTLPDSPSPYPRSNGALIPDTLLKITQSDPLIVRRGSISIEVADGSDMLKSEVFDFIDGNARRSAGHVKHSLGIIYIENTEDLEAIQQILQTSSNVRIKTVFAEGDAVSVAQRKWATPPEDAGTEVFVILSSLMPHIRVPNLDFVLYYDVPVSMESLLRTATSVENRAHCKTKVLLTWKSVAMGLYVSLKPLEHMPTDFDPLRSYLASVTLLTSPYCVFAHAEALMGLQVTSRTCSGDCPNCPGAKAAKDQASLAAGVLRVIAFLKSTPRRNYLTRYLTAVQLAFLVVGSQEVDDWICRGEHYLRTAGSLEDRAAQTMPEIFRPSFTKKSIEDLRVGAKLAGIWKRFSVFEALVVVLRLMHENHISTRCVSITWLLQNEKDLDEKLETSDGGQKNFGEATPPADDVLDQHAHAPEEVSLSLSTQPTVLQPTSSTTADLDASSQAASSEAPAEASHLDLAAWLCVPTNIDYDRMMITAERYATGQLKLLVTERFCTSFTA